MPKVITYLRSKKILFVFVIVIGVIIAVILLGEYIQTTATTPNSTILPTATISTVPLSSSPVLNLPAFSSNVYLTGISANTMIGGITIPSRMQVYYGHTLQVSYVVASLSMKAYRGEYLNNSFVLQETDSNDFVLDDAATPTSGAISSADAVTVLKNFLTTKLRLSDNSYDFSVSSSAGGYTVTVLPVVETRNVVTLQGDAPLSALVSTGGDIEIIRFANYPYMFQSYLEYPIIANTDAEQELTSGSQGIATYAQGYQSTSSVAVPVTPPGYNVTSTSLSYYYDPETFYTYPVLLITGRFEDYSSKIYPFRMLEPLINGNYVNYYGEVTPTPME